MTHAPTTFSTPADDAPLVDRIDAMPAQFSETLGQLRRTRARIASIRCAVHGQPAPDDAAPMPADIPADDGRMP